MLQHYAAPHVLHHRPRQPPGDCGQQRRVVVQADRHRAAVVETHDAVRLVDVACVRLGSARCVAVVGDACRAAGSDEDCEGMYLTVVVDPRAGALDRADAGGYPVASQADIEARLEAAP